MKLNETESTLFFFWQHGRKPTGAGGTRLALHQASFLAFVFVLSRGAGALPFRFPLVEQGGDGVDRDGGDFGMGEPGDGFCGVRGVCPALIRCRECFDCPTYLW